MFIIKRLIHETPILHRVWTSKTTDQLTERYEKYGPAWTLVSIGVRSKSPEQCRKQYIKNSKILSSIKDDRVKELIYHHGFEHLKDNTFIKYPLEKIESSPFSKLSSSLPKFRLCKFVPSIWTEREILTLLQGFEEYGYDWAKISKRMHRRTPMQCKKKLESIYVNWKQENVPNEHRINSIEPDLNLFTPKEEEY